jgi:hypothetical protein
MHADAQTELTEPSQENARALWIKSQPSYRAAVRALLATGEGMRYATPGIERQITQAHWDRAREELQRVEAALSRRWEEGR